MPVQWFKCPDGERVEVAACIAGCRMAEQCMATPIAITLGHNRPIPKVPRVSASQGGTGVREIYLKATHPYMIDPQDRADMIIGTATHARLESGASGDRFVSEQYFRNEYTSCFLDLYERHTKTLWDYKTWGSFKIKKAMGLVMAVVPDPTGAVYQRNGKGFKKGDPKMIQQWTMDPSKVDMREVELQLNIERILVKQTFSVEKLKVQAIVKEPRWYAKQHGLDRRLYVFGVKFLPDEEVIEHYKAKTLLLQEAFASGITPDYCQPWERWDGDRKCKMFCDVAEICAPPWLAKEDLDSVDMEDLF